MPIDTIVPAESQAMYDQFHFSQAVRSGDLVICSGQIGANPDGSIPKSPEDEFRNAWKGVGSVLAAADLSYENIIEYTTFHVGLQKNMRDFMKVRDEFVKEPWPAWTAIGITELAMPGARVEIRAIARK